MRGDVLRVACSASLPLLMAFLEQVALTSPGLPKYVQPCGLVQRPILTFSVLPSPKADLPAIPRDARRPPLSAEQHVGRSSFFALALGLRGFWMSASGDTWGTDDLRSYRAGVRSVEIGIVRLSHALLGSVRRRALAHWPRRSSDSDHSVPRGSHTREHVVRRRSC